MHLNKLAVLVLKSDGEKIALDYINNKIVFLKTNKKLKKNSVYLIKIKGRYSKAGKYIYKDIEFLEDEPLGEFNINLFVIKMQLLYSTIASTFDEVINYDRYKYSYHLVRFSETELRKYRDKYNLKMGKKFVNVIANERFLENNIGNKYSGYTLIEKVYLKNRKFDIYNVLSLFNDFQDKKPNEDLELNSTYDDLSNQALHNNYDKAVQEFKNVKEYDIYETENTYFDYGIYESELDYEPSFNDVSGYEASNLYDEFSITAGEEYYDLHYGDSKIQVRSNEVEEKNKDGIKKINISYETSRNMLNFIKEYKVLNINKENYIELIDYYSKFTIVREELKKSSFYEIFGKVLFYINFIELKGDKALYKVQDIEELEFALNYEKYCLLNYSIYNIDKNLLNKILDYDYRNNKDIYALGKYGIRLNDISKNLDWANHNYKLDDIPF